MQVISLLKQSNSWESIINGLNKYYDDLQKSCKDVMDLLPQSWEKLKETWFDGDLPEECLKTVGEKFKIPTKPFLDWSRGPWLEKIFSIWSIVLLERSFSAQSIIVKPRILVEGNSGVVHKVDAVGRCGRFVFVASCKNQIAEVKHIRDLLIIMGDIDVPHGIYVVSQPAPVEVQKFASYHHILVLDRFPSSPQLLPGNPQPRKTIKISSSGYNITGNS